MTDLKFDLDDIVLIPAEVTEIESRKECQIDTYINYSHITLPLMAAPMDTVVCAENYDKYIRQGIIPCIPRGVTIKSINSDEFFKSYGLSEIEEQLKFVKINDVIKLKGEKKLNYFGNYENILIDIANGHMLKLIGIIKTIKGMYPDINLMVGNVANPETFANLALAGADYIRCSIGTGAGCTTASNVSINYPMGSLISECRKQKIQLGLHNTKIVADGGMRNYSDIIKALALGADFVMIGSIFNKSIGSSGFNYLYGIKLRYDLAKKLWLWGFPVKKKYRGMSTKAVQRSWGKSQLVTAEGITKYQKVEYTLEQWTENFKDYLRSAMSYSNAKKLDDFVGYAQYVFITENARRRFDK
jgi:IMP dehydrogenase/GMP reductase